MAGTPPSPTSSSPVWLPPSVFLHARPSLVENQDFNDCFPSQHPHVFSQNSRILENLAALFTKPGNSDPEKEVIGSRSSCNQDPSLSCPQLRALSTTL